MLEGFKPYIMAAGAPTITFSKNGLGVSKAAVAKLNNAKHVRILFDQSGKRMAIQVCNEDDFAAVEFAKSEKPEGARWNTRDLSVTIKKITGWSTDNDETYRIDGEFVEDEQHLALVFDFATAKRS